MKPSTTVFHTACVHDGCSQYTGSHAAHPALVLSCAATYPHAPSSPSPASPHSPPLSRTHSM